MANTWLILIEQLLWAGLCLSKPRTQAATVTATVYIKAKIRTGKESYPSDRPNNFKLILHYCKYLIQFHSVNPSLDIKL